MSESKKVVCGAHGGTPATFTCRHVARGVACGFYTAETPGDPWPDAWCDLCEEALQAAGGEWNDAAEEQADIQLICTHCYEAARDRNRQVPPLARGASAVLSDEEISRLIRRAVNEAEAAQERSNRLWSLREMARWDFDAEASTLTFSDPHRATVLADVRLVGSYSTTSNTFQWVWETYAEDGPEATAIVRLRVFGEVRGIARLTTPNWEAEEVDGWEMASLAAYLLGAEGLYRAPFEHVFWFMLLANLRTIH